MSKKVQNTKNTYNTIITIALAILVIAIYIGINILIEKIELENIDITKNKLYSLTQETKNKIANIKETKISIFGFNIQQNEEILNKLKNYAKEYTKQNPKITYEYIENIMIGRPDLASKYGLESNSNEVIIETEDRTKILLVEDLYKYEKTTKTEIDSIEQAITNAIIDVNIENRPKVYFVTNKIKYPETSKTVTEYLKNEANEVEELDIEEKKEIPEDCNVLVLTTIKEDITELEKQLIIEYINKGGKILILADPKEEEEEFNNYNQILEMYGVSISKGYINEASSTRRIRNYLSIIIPNLSEESDITKNIATDGMVVFIDTGKIKLKTKEVLKKLGVEVTNLVTASQTAFYREDQEEKATQKTEKDEDAANEILGAYITKTIENGEKSELIIFANSIFASDIPISLDSQEYMYGIYTKNNKNLILNSITKLAGRTDKITVRKDTGIVPYTPTEEQDKIIKIVIIVIPAVILIIGIIIWLIRRKK